MVTNWKAVRPSSICHAMELCVDYAKARKNLSVDRIADLMGEHSKYTLYKYISDGTMPVGKIRNFEYVCGNDFVTQYLAHSQDKLVVTIPPGRNPTSKNLNDLSVAMHQTAGLLIEFYDANKNAEETLHSLITLMEDLSYQHRNVKKCHQPELL